jgi:two-component system, response regulator YesN
MLKLLIVDDEKRTRQGIRSCIPWNSFGIGLIEEADDGDTALEISSKIKPDIILSDIRMPRMTGIEFAALVRKELPKCKLIFLSGYSDKEYLKSAIQLNAIHYIEKPVNVQELKEVIRTAVDLCLSELKESSFISETSTKLEASKPIIREQLALYLTESHISIDKVNDMLSLGNVDMPFSGSYVTVLYRLNPSSEIISEVQETLCNNLIRSIDCIYSDDKLKFVSCVKDSINVLTHIHLSSSINVYDIKASSEKVRCKFKQTSNYAEHNKNILFIGIGSAANGMDYLFTSYQTAFLAVQKVFFLGNTGTVIYGDKFQTPYTYDKSHLDKFTELLYEMNIEGTIEFIENTAQEIVKHDTTLIDNVKALFFKLLERLYSCMEEKNIVSDNTESQKEFLWQIVSNSLTLEELKNYLIKRVNDYFQIINSKLGVNRVAYEIIFFIQRNYMNKSLSIGLISESLNLTPAYLCQIFKRETGKTINDYINEYRIEKAKEFLKDRSIKLFEVSGNSGYNDVKYFTKTFKKFAGITPTEYREKIL